MSKRYRLPVFTDDILSQIIWGMENQDVDYYLNIKDGNVIDRDSYDVSVPDEYLLDLPPWGSSDGYQLMVSFVNVCKNQRLKEKLLHELSSRSHGVFRRFRDTLATDPDSLKQWYEFKDHRMKAHIKAWYRTNFGSSEKSSDDNDDELGFGDLLADFEIVHLETLDCYCERLLDDQSSADPVFEKTIVGFKDKQAFEVRKDNAPCGALIYENVGTQSCILYYHIEESQRELGLFSLMFDMFNRELERQQISKVMMVFIPKTSFFKGVISGHDVALEQSFEGLEYSIRDWNGSSESSEFAYLL